MRPLAEDAIAIKKRFRKGGKMRAAAMATEINGRIAVCGFLAIEKRIDGIGATVAMVSQAASNGTVSYNDVVLVENLRFMNLVSPERFGLGTSAACRVTDKPWITPIKNVDLDLRIRTYRKRD